MEDNMIEKWNVERLVPYAKNAKKHDAKQVAKIAASIKQFGWRGSPILAKPDGEIINGHGRRLAAISLGMPVVPVIVAHGMTDEEIRALRLADNRVSISDYDTDMLQEELLDLDYDLAGIFDSKELDFMSADLGEIKQEAFVVDLDTEVANQAAETVKKIAETDERVVKIDKALGFKSINGRDERAVARFMAQIEADTGLEGAEAFVKFVSDLMNEA